MEMTVDPASTWENKPIVILVIGMAGSGKSTFVSKAIDLFSKEGKRVYSVNLDPAVSKLTYNPNVDIRDTINYRQVMTEFALGPNGAIITSLNLFATKFDQVLSLLEKRASDLDVVIIDTPGQIEVFNWSASGTIITDSLSLSFPVITAYILDSERCQSPITFMSNMTYACSIMYKTKLPFVLLFNKIDSHDATKATEWIRDFNSYLADVQLESSYMGSLSRSLCLALEEFYSSIRYSLVSSITGDGFKDFFDSVELGRVEFMESYIPYLQHRKDEVNAKRLETAKRQLKELEESKLLQKHGSSKKGHREEEEDDEDESAELEAFRRFMNK